MDFSVRPHMLSHYSKTQENNYEMLQTPKIQWEFIAAALVCSAVDL